MRHFAQAQTAEAELLDTRFGYKTTILDRAGLAEQIRAAGYHGGLYDPQGGHFHPLNYAFGLASAALAAGVQIFEQSRVTSLIEDARVIARRIAPNRRLLCASPAYLKQHGTPRTPHELARHNCIGIRQGEEAYGTWRLTHGRGKQAVTETVKTRGSLTTNDGEIAVNWALDGHGILMRADGPEGGYARWLQASDGVQIRVGVWPCSGAKGTVFLMPGRTEYIEKYGRAATDLAQRGYATVSIDWRGQGLADRPLDAQLTGHVDDFGEYQLDMDAVLTCARAEGLPEPWFMLAHSMGGCIGSFADNRRRTTLTELPASVPMGGPRTRPGLTVVSAKSFALANSHAARSAMVLDNA